MEHFEEYALDREGSLAVTAEPPEWLDTDRPEHEEFVNEPASSDDPVRVYLREMGSVRLLNRQGEIDLARRMERGNRRMRKALSRSPLVARSVLALHEGARAGTVRLEEFVEVGGVDEEAKAAARMAVMRRLARVARLDPELLAPKRQRGSAPKRYGHL